MGRSEMTPRGGGGDGLVLSRRGALKVFAAGLADVALAAAVVGGDYGLCYRLARGLDAVGIKTSQSGAPASLGAMRGSQFSQTPKKTSASYRDADVSVSLTQRSCDSGVVDTSGDGSYARYGSRVRYVLADVYVSSVECIRTGFAQDTYGVGYEEQLSGMSARLGSVLAVNGDSYSNNRHRKNGTIVRNGQMYRDAPATDETCVLYRDGTMRIFRPEELDPEQLVADGAWQSWVFGPSLLDNGRAKDSFFTWDYIRRSHPRTAIGYFEPGHYCFLAVDGRQAEVSRGMLLSEMASLFEGLGCQLAYNLDGGSCSFMTFGDQVVNHPYSPQHAVSDGIFICSTKDSGTQEVTMDEGSSAV